VPIGPCTCTWPDPLQRGRAGEGAGTLKRELPDEVVAGGWIGVRRAPSSHSRVRWRPLGSVPRWIRLPGAETKARRVLWRRPSPMPGEIETSTRSGQNNAHPAHQGQEARLNCGWVTGRYHRSTVTTLHRTLKAPLRQARRHGRKWLETQPMQASEQIV